MPDAAVDAEIQVQVKENKDSTYEYVYSFQNLPNSKLPIKMFFLESQTYPLQTIEPKFWKLYSWGDRRKDTLKWSGNEQGWVNIGQKSEPFTVVSKDGPGLVRVQYKGFNVSGPKRAYTDVERTEKTLCPGGYQLGSSTDGSDTMAMTMAIGPVPKNRITGNIRIKRPTENKWTGSLEQKENELLAIPPTEQGLVQVILFGDDAVDVNKVDVSTLTFGRGNAKPVKVEIVSNALGAADQEYDNKLAKKKYQNLVMQFKLDDVNVLCNLDRALFLQGKFKDKKELFAGARIQWVWCDENTWAKERKLMIKNGLLEYQH